jgi:hypothetical protein
VFLQNAYAFYFYFHGISGCIGPIPAWCGGDDIAGEQGHYFGDETDKYVYRKMRKLVSVSCLTSSLRRVWRCSFAGERSVSITGQ